MLRSFNGKVYLACGPTDLRKSIDGLAIIVTESFYPKTIYYMNQKIIIEKIEYIKEHECLHVFIRKPDENILSFSLAMDGVRIKGNRGCIDGQIQYELYEVKESQKYTIIIEHPRYYVPLKKKVKLKLN